MRTVVLVLSAPILCAFQTAKPLLTFNKMHHDFGKVPEDKKVVYRFKATNAGTVPVQIRQIAQSCGCNSTNVGQWWLRPGEETSIELSFDPKGRHGALRKSIQVFYDEGGNTPASNTVATLTFDAEVVQEVMLSKTAIFFDEMSRTTPKKDTVRLQSGTDKSVRVITVKASGAPYLLSSFRGDGKDALLDVTFDGTKVPPGKSSGLDTLTIHTNNDRMSQIPLDVQWNMRPVFAATPTRIAWVEPAGKELKATLTLRHVEGKSFKVLDASPTHNHIRVEGLRKPAAAQQELTFYFSSKAKPGAYVERVRLSLDSREQSDFEVRVSAVLK